MDIKRTILAVAISFVILVGWNYLAEEMGWIKKTVPAPQTQQQSAPQSAATQTADAPLPALVATPGKQVVVETPLYKAVFNSNGGVLQEFSLRQYHMGIENGSPSVPFISTQAATMAPLGLLVDGVPTWNNAVWTLEGDSMRLTAGQNGSLRFICDLNGLRLTRELTFAADKYAFEETVRLTSPTARSLRLSFTLSTGKMDGGGEYNAVRIAYNQDAKFHEESSEGTLQTGINPKGDMAWASVMTNYFIAAISPLSATSDISVKGKLQDGVYRVAVEKDNIALQAGQEASYSSLYYLGPKDQEVLVAERDTLSTAVDYGMFSIIARPLMALLKFFYSYVNNYGVAIILLTLIIKIVLWPLSYKSYKSMEQMKKLQPMVVKLREKYKDDKESLNRETMQLYKTYKVNPAGGCLPIIVQIPVFFGLYQGLLHTIDLRHASFVAHLPFTDMIWLADLSAKDPYYSTPLIMGGTMFLQQWMTPAAGDPTQQKVMMIMPVVFTFLFLNFPSGLVVYWLTNNVISIAQQWLQLRRA